MARQRTKRPEGWEPELTFPADHRQWAGKPRCRAWNDKLARQCAKMPVKGLGHPAAPEEYKTVCRLHGGASPGGIASATFKHGRDSKYVRYVAKKLRPSYDAAMSEPDELLNLTSDIALKTARLDDLQRQLDEGEAPARMLAEIAQAYRSLIAASRRGDKDGQRQAGAKLEELVERGEREHMVWLETRDETEARRKLVATEIKRRETARAVIKTEDAQAAAFALAMANKYVIETVDLTDITPAELLDRIEEEFRRLSREYRLQMAMRPVDA